jgi:peptidoglycan-associated lipoprotein
MKLTYVLAAALVLTMVGTGCQKRPYGVTPLKNPTTVIHQPVDPTLPAIDPNLDPNIRPFGIEQTPERWMTNPDAHTEDPAALAAHTVHFDYDSSVIKSSEQANVEAAASYVKNDSNVGLRIDGHCDERGTEGYNDALGERRAAALRDAVIALGADPNRVITQSWGERKPVSTAQDESAYAQNRRGEFIVLRKK